MAVAASGQFVRRSIEKSLKDLPALPDAVMKVVQETNKVEPSAARVEQYITSDQALTSKLLRVVNSAYYGLSGHVSSVGQAIVILGMQQVRNLVLSVGAVSAFETSTAAQRDALKTFWLHAFTTAAASQYIAKWKKLDPALTEVMFVGGLLHDIGRLFLYCNFTTAYEQAIARAQKTGETIEQSERAVLGVDHAEVGMQMATIWKLPQAIIHMIGRHEGPFNEEETPLVFGVHVADAVTKYLYYAPQVVFPTAIEPRAEEWLEMNGDEFTELTDQVAIKAEAALQLFGLLAA